MMMSGMGQLYENALQGWMGIFPVDLSVAIGVRSNLLMAPGCALTIFWAYNDVTNGAQVHLSLITSVDELFTWYISTYLASFALENCILAYYASE